MDAAALLKLVILTSVMLVVASIGMSTRQGTALGFLKDPAPVSKAMLAMFVAMPLFTLLVTWALPLDPAVRIALLALAISPMPPVMPLTQAKVGADTEYAIGIQVAACATALAAAPLFILLLEEVYHHDVAFEIGPMLKVLVLTISVPLTGGILMNRFAPDFAARVRGPVGKAAGLTLALGMLVMLAISWRDIAGALGNGALVAILLMTLFGLAVGHLLGGPHPGNRSALATATASRHPGVAIAVGAVADPTAISAIVGAVLLYLLANAAFIQPYLRWAKARAALARTTLS